MPKELVPYFNIEVEGSEAPRWVLDTLIECVVENSIHLPDMCTFRLHVDPIQDNELKALDTQVLREGKQIRISGSEEGASLTQLFVGEITSIEVDLNSLGSSSILIRSMARSHRLHRGRKRMSFKQKSDSDIVQQVASQAGFDVKATSTSPVRDWVMQNNQTDWEFISMLAARNGFRLFLKDKTELHFEPVSNDGDNEIELEWGKELRSFRPRISASSQVDTVVVRGWDMKTKAAVVGTATSPNGIPEISDGSQGPQIGKKAFGGAKMVVVDRPVTTNDEATKLAQSVLDEISGEFLEAEGLCFAQPKLKPGVNVKIKNIGTRFSGKYFVTSTNHTYTPAEGYLTQFSVTGKKSPTFLELARQGGISDRKALGEQIVVALVTGLKDPENLGRVKVKYPWLSEEDESDWVRLSAPMGGKGRGFQFTPEIDDEVLVAFEHGDIHRPFIIGALWNGKDEPVEPNSTIVKSDQVVHRIIKTRIGHTMLFDDTDTKGEIRLTTCNKHFLTLNDRDENITATTKDNHVLIMDDKNQNVTVTTKGNHTLTLDDKNKKITVKTTSGHELTMDDQGSKILLVDKTGSNKMTIDSNANSIDMECNGNFSLKANGQVSIQGQAGVDIKSGAMMNIQSSAPMTIKGGPIVSINS